MATVKIALICHSQIPLSFCRHGRIESVRSEIVLLFTVDKLLKGSFTRVMRSRSGSFSKAHEESFYVLPLVEIGGKSDPKEVFGHPSLESSLAAFVKEEPMTGANQLVSSQGIREDGVIQTQIREIPPILVIQLKRFMYSSVSQHVQKLNHFFSFPVKLDMSPFSTSPAGNEYSLQSVFIHGGTISCGHYLSYNCTRRSGVSSQWCQFNDTNVSEVSLAEILEKSFGHKRETPVAKSVPDSDDSFSSTILSSENETDFSIGGKSSRLQLKGGGEEFHLDERVTSAYMLVYVRSELVGGELEGDKLEGNGLEGNGLEGNSLTGNPSTANTLTNSLTNPLTNPLHEKSTNTTSTDRFIRQLLCNDLLLRQQDFLDNCSVSLQLHSAHAFPANASLFADQLLTRRFLHQLGVSIGIPTNCQDWWLGEASPAGIRVTRRLSSHEFETEAGELTGVWRAGRCVLSLYCRNACDANFAVEWKHLKREEFLVFVELGGKTEDFLVIPAMTVDFFYSRVIDHFGGVKLTLSSHS